MDTCQVRVSDGGRFASSHKCGRPVKESGLCGIHLAAKRRRAERDQTYREEREDQGRIKREAEELCDRLAAVGIVARPAMVGFFTSRGPKYTGGIEIQDPKQSEDVVNLACERWGNV